MAKFVKTERGIYVNAKAISAIEPYVNYWSYGDGCVCTATISAKIIGEGLQTNALNAFTGNYSMTNLATIGLNVNCSNVMFHQTARRTIVR